MGEVRYCFLLCSWNENPHSRTFKSCHSTWNSQIKCLDISLLIRKNTFASFIIKVCNKCQYIKYLVFPTKPQISNSYTQRNNRSKSSIWAFFLIPMKISHVFSMISRAFCSIIQHKMFNQQYKMLKQKVTLQI